MRQPVTVSAIVLSLGMGLSLLSLADEVRSPYQIVDEASAGQWRAIDQDNSLYIDLESGTVVVELNPHMAPANAANIKQLVRQGFYDGLSVYRVVEGFVAQGGDAREPRDTGKAKRRLPGEFVHMGDLSLPYTPVNQNDGFADHSGYVNGFPIGRQGDLSWMLHCPGAFALARGDEPASGGTEFYVVLGHAPRYLDRNVTVFGMVRWGMEHYQSLKRGSDASGQLDRDETNLIRQVRLGSDLSPKQRLPLEIMRTESESFRELIESRASRPEPWFVFQPGFVDTCGVPVPVRLSARSL